MNFLNKSEAKIKRQIIENAYIHLNEKSRLIPDENKLLTQLNPIWINVQKEYELIQILGRGSYGTVVKAKH